MCCPVVPLTVFLQISEIITHMRISLLYTPVSFFIRRFSTNAVTLVSYQTSIEKLWIFVGLIKKFQLKIHMDVMERSEDSLQAKATTMSKEASNEMNQPNKKAYECKLLNWFKQERWVGHQSLHFLLVLLIFHPICLFISTFDSKFWPFGCLNLPFLWLFGGFFAG